MTRACWWCKDEANALDGLVRAGFAAKWTPDQGWILVTCSVNMRTLAQIIPAIGPCEARVRYDRRGYAVRAASVRQGRPPWSPW